MTNSNENMMVGTHDGRFHLDEITAIQLLKIIYPRLDIVRTRNDTLLGNCDILVDVGKVYDPENGKFDHHQRNCNETFDEYSQVPLSSAGMIYKHFGKRVINIIYNQDKSFEETELTDELRNYIYNDFYKKFIREIDANDNGYSHIKDEYKDKDIYKFYRNLNLANIVKYYNSDDVNNNDEQLRSFNVVGSIVMQCIITYMRGIIKECIFYDSETEQICKYLRDRTNPRIIVCTEDTKTLYSHLKSLDPNKEICFNIYPRDNNQWGISTMQDNRINRIDLITEEEAKKLYGNDVVFIHKNLFCCATKTQQVAYDICIKSIEKYHRNRKMKIGCYILGGSIIGSIIVGSGSYFLLKK